MNKEQLVNMPDMWVHNHKEGPFVPMNPTNVVEIITMVIDNYEKPFPPVSSSFYNVYPAFVVNP